jgi:hypothetical protein
MYLGKERLMILVLHIFLGLQLLVTGCMQQLKMLTTTKRLVEET